MIDGAWHLLQDDHHDHVYEGYKHQTHSFQSSVIDAQSSKIVIRDTFSSPRSSH